MFFDCPCNAEDYDCFYAAVFEAEDPALRGRPLGVQQKQIIVTCNYAARAKGLYKLQLVKEAKKLVPDIVIKLGEDLTRFRDKSQELLKFLCTFTWSGKCERLGLDEVFLDVTDVVSANVDGINASRPKESFFRLSRHDSSLGFSYDASAFAGSTFPDKPDISSLSERPDEELSVRLALGSHLARHIRQLLAQEKGFTAAVGISTNKLLSKLIGNLNKPDGQTTLAPPYDSNTTHGSSSVLRFLDPLEIGKIPGIGFKVSQSIKRAMLSREPCYQEGLVVGKSNDFVSASDVRHAFTVTRLEETLGGRLGRSVFDWLHGRDVSEVLKRLYPTQISFEDTYLDLSTVDQVRLELLRLTKRLISRMRVDLVDPAAQADYPSTDYSRLKSGLMPFRYAAVPRAVRLSTRLRRPVGERSFQRASRSAPMPPFVLSTSSVDDLAPRLVQECLFPLFKRLHEADSGWTLNLVNVAATDISDEGSRSFDVADMMLRNKSSSTVSIETLQSPRAMSEEYSEPGPTMKHTATRRDLGLDIWDDDTPANDDTYENAVQCELCNVSFPVWALAAHLRYHEEPADNRMME